MNHEKKITYYQLDMSHADISKVLFEMKKMHNETWPTQYNELSVNYNNAGNQAIVKVAHPQVLSHPAIIQTWDRVDHPFVKDILNGSIWNDRLRTKAQTDAINQKLTNNKILLGEK